MASRLLGVAWTVIAILTLGRAGLTPGNAHDLRIVAPLETESLVANTCSGVSIAPAFTDLNGSYMRKYNTIAHRFLDDEVGAGDVTPAMFVILDQLIDEAVQTLEPLLPNSSKDEAVAMAKRTLNAIDCILLRHGFVYPGHGLVQLLSDGLGPTMYDNPNDFAELIHQRHNIRREVFINSRGPGPFYVVDCDTASFIYLAVAEVLHYPINLVDIPAHNFVRWNFDDGSYLNYETMLGAVTEDSYYTSLFGIPEHFQKLGGILRSMDVKETIAYHDNTVAVAWSWRGDYTKMVDTYLRSMARDPM